MKLTVTQRAYSPGDWHVGYLDETPAIGDQYGRWYTVSTDAVIHNPGDRLVWVLKHEYGVWECLHDMHWQDQYVDPQTKWIKETPDYVEKVEKR